MRFQHKGSFVNSTANGNDGKPSLQQDSASTYSATCTAFLQQSEPALFSLHAAAAGSGS